VISGNTLAYIDNTGKTVLSPEYDDGGSFIDGVAVVTKDKKFGLIDKTGKLLLPLIYDGVLALHHGLVAFKSGDKIIIYSVKGEELKTIK